ncbi:DUF6064 family protein [Modicisalibacter radicis]|uniref:DUF6064 family protein n=1 Tax=Halomonas sp. EAR18 TaxID=2518972 RepID=UPI00109D65A4|nr:DUF6064 family protein [Halomonas sp. EAR18]
MLPYSSEVLFALFGQVNRELWPVLVLLYALAAGCLVLVWRLPGRKASARALSCGLALFWAWHAVAEFVFFAPFDFAAPYYAGLFLLEALALLGAGVLGRPRYRPRGGVGGRVAAVLIGHALIGYPLLDWLAGEEPTSLRVLGMAPGPTMLFTAGLLLLGDVRSAVWLLIVPVLWGLYAGLLASWLGLMQDAVLPLASLLAGWMVLGRVRRGDTSG